MYLTHLKDLCYIKALWSCIRGKAINRFRISSHNLRIETGTYERERLPCGKMVKEYVDYITSIMWRMKSISCLNARRSHLSA